MPAKLPNIQALRAIAALMVLIAHVRANEVRASADALLSPWLLHGVAGVDLFFVISGFVMVWITGQSGQKPHIGRFLFNRAARIYPAAWLWTSVAIIGFVAAGTLSQWLSQSGILFSYLLLPQQNPPLLGVSWTLIHELYFYLVFAGLLLVPRRWLPIGLAVWAGLVALVLGGGNAAANPWTALAFHPLTFEFLLGAGIGLIVRRWSIPHGGWIALAGVAAMLTGIVYLGKFPDASHHTWWGRVIAYAPGASLIVLGLASLDRQGGWQLPGWLVWTGDRSYTLYLSHLIVISTLAHIWTRFAMAGPLDNLVMIAVMLTAPLVVAWLCVRPTLLARTVAKYGVWLFTAGIGCTDDRWLNATVGFTLVGGGNVTCPCSSL